MTLAQILIFSALAAPGLALAAMGGILFLLSAFLLCFNVADVLTRDGAADWAGLRTLVIAAVFGLGSGGALVFAAKAYAS